MFFPRPKVAKVPFDPEGRDLFMMIGFGGFRTPTLIAREFPTYPAGTSQTRGGGVSRKAQGGRIRDSAAHQVAQRDRTGNDNGFHGEPKPRRGQPVAAGFLRYGGDASDSHCLAENGPSLFPQRVIVKVMDR